ncbi:nucleotide exchange factor GrpE [Candidatus Saccharibacteria bacterium]|nr:nucleotide exchange factor GrpE [Candidatus Saccharibacteria bacterium]
MPKSKKTDKLEQQIAELTLDLQRQRADFENYRKQVEREKTMAREAGQTSMIMKLVPVIDNIERAIMHIPAELAENTWAQGIAGLTKQLEQSLKLLNVARIDARPGTVFNPELHEAVQFDEEAEGEHEVIAEELQAGYTLNGSPIRHSMVKVTRK